MADIKDPIAWCEEMLKESQLYHGTRERVEQFEPRNLHGDIAVEDAVFASPSRSFAMVYSGRRWGDRDINKGIYGPAGDRKIHIREMRPGAIDDIFKGQRGYMYTLPEETFEPITADRNMSSNWEVISREPVVPSSEEIVEDVLEELQKDPNMVFHPYDIKDPETRKSLERRIKTYLKLENEGRHGYKDWWFKKAPDEIKEMWEELEAEERNKRLTKEGGEAGSGHVFVTGVPGAGKTTEAQRMAGEMGLPLISLDGLPREHGAPPPDTETLRKFMKEYLDTPHIIEGSQVMGMNQGELDGSRVIFVDQPRDTIIDRLVDRGLFVDGGRRLIGEDAREEIGSEHDQISQIATQFLKRVNPEIISPKPALIKKASSVIDFPKGEHPSLRARLDADKDIYTTRISAEKGEYFTGDVLDSPFGKLKVVGVRQGKLKQHPFLSELTEDQKAEIGDNPFDLVRLKKTSSLPSQDEIFDDVLGKMPGAMRKHIRHASGGLPDVRGVSDVDALIFAKNHKNLLPVMPKGTTVDSSEERTIYQVPGYAREVNIYVAPKSERAQRSLVHRKNEKILEDKFPQLASVAAQRKAEGLSTEKAWAKVLDLSGDPYDAMLDTRQVLTSAMEKSSGIRMSKEASMKKKAQMPPVKGVQPVQGVGQEGGAGGRQQQQQQELQAWQRWIQDRNKEDFTFLLDSYAPFMNYMGQRHLQTAKTAGTLPPSTIKADMIQNFHRAMETYDPNKGQLNTHIGNHLRHTGRFVRSYANIGKMPDPRSRMVWQYKDRETVLTERLGRQPSSIEMADDLGMSVKDIELLRTEIRKDIIVDPTTAGMGSIAPESPKAMEQLNFLHMELGPEQQNVLEYTYGMHGRQAVDNNEELAQIIGISPQKVRAIKRQIARKYEKRYR